MSKLPSETFCIYPWIHLNTWPNGNVFQCCITDYTNHIGNLNEETLEEVWNNDYMKNLRLEMLAGKEGTGCSKCFQQEAHGIQSSRQSANKNFEHHIDAVVEQTLDDGTNTEFDLRFWDFRFSNLCNMKCRMCGGHLSSLWNNDEIALYGHASEPDIVVNTRDNSKEDLYDLLDNHIDKVEEIYFAGGEPLIMDEHYYILEKLIEQKRFNVRLRYNTNLSKIKFKKWDNLELWKHFDSVHVIASIDAIEERGEYIRKGTVWQTIEDSIKTLLPYKDDFMLGFSPTTNVFNVLHLPDLVQYLFDTGISVHNIHLNNVLTNPPWYHISILDNEYKDKIRTKYAEHLASITKDYIREDLAIKYNSVLTYLEQTFSDEETAQHRAKFIKITKQVDKLRKESFVDVFPELVDFYNGIYHD